VKTYLGWIDKGRGPVCRVQGRRRHYWLRRRDDLLAFDDVAAIAPALEPWWLWTLAVDLLADSTGQDDLAARAAPDFVRQLAAADPAEWVMFEEHIHDWVVAWACREIGLLPARQEVSGD
jgi:hypothetical protein